MEEKLEAYRQRKALETRKNKGPEGSTPAGELEDNQLVHRYNKETTSSTSHITNKSCRTRFPGNMDLVRSWMKYVLDKRGVDVVLSFLSTGFLQFVLRLAIWICLLTFFVKCGFGLVFVILSAFYWLYYSMSYGSRTSSEPSAYSVFNEGFERLDGTFTAEQFERELKGGLGPPSQ